MVREWVVRLHHPPVNPENLRRGGYYHSTIRVWFFEGTLLSMVSKGHQQETSPRSKFPRATPVTTHPQACESAAPVSAKQKAPQAESELLGHLGFAQNGRRHPPPTKRGGGPNPKTGCAFSFRGVAGLIWLIALAFWDSPSVSCYLGKISMAPRMGDTN